MHLYDKERKTERKSKWKAINLIFPTCTLQYTIELLVNDKADSLW